MRKKNTKSYAKRIIKVWFLGIVVPLLLVETLMLWQFYRINHREVDEGIENVLLGVSSEIDDLMSSMNSVSWLMQEDGTVGKNISQYFEESDSTKRADLLIYIREQIANYEAAISNIANLTYLHVPRETGHPVKINSSSLYNGKLPTPQEYLCSWKESTFYGVHPTNSHMGNYNCISLLRPYVRWRGAGDVYIYVESGYEFFDKLLPQEQIDAGMVLLIESADGKTVYSSDEALVPIHKKTSDYLKKYVEDSRRYIKYEKKHYGDWSLYLLVPARQYYKQISGLMLNLGLVTILVVAGGMIISVMQWQTLYRPFTKFERKLKQIAAGDDVETQVEQMNIKEFDDNFALVDKMKQNIQQLLKQVQAEEKKRVDLEIKVVMGKINPHFLYNTLDTLKWYAAGKSDKEMVHFITALNKLLLYNMSKTKKTTLQSELEAVKAYIALQELKYDIDFHVDAGKHPEILQADMPRFLLQPLVENAILHSGLNKGRVWVEVELLVNGKIAILVKNDGTPIDPERFKEVLVQKHDISTNGIGLQYVARMLESRFGKDFELKAEYTEDGINVVEIRIPFETEEVEKTADGIGGGVSGL